MTKSQNNKTEFNNDKAINDTTVLKPSAGTIQTCLDTVLVTPSLTDTDSTLTMESLQSDIKDIKSMLASMSLSSTLPNTFNQPQQENFAIKEAKNLLELSMFNEIRVEISDEGSLIQCLVCNNFQQSSLIKRIT